MKKIYLGVTLLCCVTLTFGQAPTCQWAYSMGGVSIDYGIAVAHDASGNVYTTGWFNGTVDFDPGTAVYNLTSVGNGDIYVSKLDASGNFVWAKKMGGVGDDRGFAIAVDASGNVYTTGWFAQGSADFDPGLAISYLTSNGGNDIFVSKLDASGNFVWAKGLGGSAADNGYGIAVDAAGNVYTTGFFESTADFDPGGGIFTLTAGANRDVFVSKLDVSGNFVWAKAMGGALGYDDGYGIALDASGNVYTAGKYSSAGDFDPGPGVFTLTPTGGVYSVFISKLTAAGNFVWAKSFEGTGYSWGNGIALNQATSSIYTVGYFTGTVDFDPGTGVYNLTSGIVSDIFVSKLDTAGNFIWATGLGGQDMDQGYAISLDGTGNVFTIGTFTGPGDFDPGAGTYTLTSTNATRDIFISKLDSSGNFVWAKAIGGNGDDIGSSLSADVSGDLYITGYYTLSPIVFDAFSLTNNGTGNTFDLFVAKLGSETVGMEDQETNSSLSVFPNPASETVTIDAGNIIVKRVQILNMLGQTVKELEVDTGYLTMDISNMTKGLYFIRLTTDKTDKVRKMIIK